MYKKVHFKRLIEMTERSENDDADRKITIGVCVMEKKVKCGLEVLPFARVLNTSRGSFNGDILCFR